LPQRCRDIAADAALESIRLVWPKASDRQPLLKNHRSHPGWEEHFDHRFREG